MEFKIAYPEKIVCLSGEIVDILILLGEKNRIKGIPSYVRHFDFDASIARLGSFTKVDIEKVKEINPDLIFAYSFVQKDLAKQFIGEGFDFHASNFSNIEELYQYIYFISKFFDKREQAMNIINELKERIKTAKTISLRKKPKVYFEEWDEPMIANAAWTSELIESCGAIDICRDLSRNKIAMERQVTSDFVVKENPDIIFASWCGKKVNLDSISSREDWDTIEAVKSNRLYELDPNIFLQPGPRCIKEGIKVLSEIFSAYEKGIAVNTNQDEILYG